jgi:hypothetical protein
MKRAERLSRELDKAIDRQLAAREVFTEACAKVREARQAYEQETGGLIEIHF